MTNPEEMRKKSLNTSLPSQTTAAVASSSTSTTTIATGGSSSISTLSPSTSSGSIGNLPTLIEPERTYVFPSLSAYGATNAASSRISTQPIPTKGHARSVSHGGGSLSTSLGTAAGRPLKSAMKGHQRALSQGQISENVVPTHQQPPPPPRSGHNRVGSKTDFILPPGHKDLPVPSRGDAGTSATSTILGHSRQASRSESIYTLRRVEIPPWWKRLIFCRSNKFDDRGYRLIVPNHTVPPKTPKHDHPNGRRVGNKIRTTKYTVLSFLPKNLLEQFHRVANLYFIFIVVLNWYIDAFGKEISMIPVVFVLGVTAIKDLFEDRRRRASDKRINNSTCRVYNG